MRRRAKVDGNQARVVTALRCVPGVSAEPGLSRLGQGWPDLLVGYQVKTWPVELKDSAQPASKRKLTEDEVRWAERWRGSYILATDAETILKQIGAMD